MEALELIRQNKVSATYLAIVLSALPALAYAVSSYRAYVAFGPHGLPDNFRGWLTQVSAHAIARTDTRVPAPWKESDLPGHIYTPETRKAFLPSDQVLAPRTGIRPVVPSFNFPQRQTSQTASSAMIQSQNEFFGAIVSSNPALFERKTSGLEKQGEALWFAPGRKTEMPQILRKVRGEFAHIHPEGSTHLILSLPDSAMVIERGWGERHRLSGPMIPWGYTLVYAPRDQQELDVWKQILKASLTLFGAISTGSASPMLLAADGWHYASSADGFDQLFLAAGVPYGGRMIPVPVLVAWVEEGMAPDKLAASSNGISRDLCEDLE